MHKQDNEIALLPNVALFNDVMQKVIARAPNMPGIGAFVGPAGHGKTTAGSSAMHRHQAFYIQVKSIWTIKDFYRKLVEEMLGPKTPQKTASQMLDLIGEHLVSTGRPLIIDEADYLTETDRKIAALRDIYEATGAEGTLILIGEEHLPTKLERWERIHSRLHTIGYSVPVTVRDCAALAALYCPGIAIDPDLLAALCAATKGITRRVCIDLDRMRQFCEVEGLKELSAGQWEAQGFTTGRTPRRADVLGAMEAAA